MKTKRCPIRLMFGIGNNMIQGFSAVYEREDGAVASVNIWYEGDIFPRVKFTDSDQSEIVFIEVEEGIFFKGKRWVIDEVIISRKFQAK